MQTLVTPTLRESLTYEPKELQFGTSGRRGEVIHLTQLEVFINAVAELEFLKTLPKSDGGIECGDEFYFARDLRLSSSHYVPEQHGRGELAQAIELAICYTGMIPVNEGMIPTPALTLFALSKGKGSIMVTGSHIPFDRNGYKTNTSKGELLKQHEQPIGEKVREVRAKFYNQPLNKSMFGTDGLLKEGSKPLSAERNEAANAYIKRYADFFGMGALSGLKLLVYQHSAVGRDMLVAILKALGADAIAAGRSETFVPIDTENMDDGQLAVIQSLHDKTADIYGRFDAIVSTDGDSDRPLILGVDPKSSALQFFGGDLVGMLTAELLRADAVVVPISCNDSIDRSSLKNITEPKTRIGSPFVIAGMDKALASGKQAVCGWEANGGFLTGSDFKRDGRTLTALPTRDAILPILAVLSIARREGLPLIDIFSRLPRRFSRSALIKQFPRTISLAIVKRFCPADASVKSVEFNEPTCPAFKDADNQVLPANSAQTESMIAIKMQLESVFNTISGFGTISQINFIDGVRLYFSSGEVAHLRPSGNADEFRIYAVADTQDRADQIAAMAVAEPDGLLHQLAKVAN
jgi:phosphomannomutase